MEEPRPGDLGASTGDEDTGGLGEGVRAHLLGELARTAAGEHESEDGVDVLLEDRAELVGAGQRIGDRRLVTSKLRSARRPHKSIIVAIVRNLSGPRQILDDAFDLPGNEVRLGRLEMIRSSLFVGLVVMALVAGACGSSASETVTGAEVATSAPTTDSPATTVETTTTEATTTTAAPTTTAPTTTSSPTTTTTLVPATPLEGAAGGTSNLNGWVVDPGRYSTDRIGIPVELTFDEAVTWFDGDGLIEVGRSNVSGDQNDVVVIVAPVGIIPATEIGVHPPHDPIVPVNTEPFPEDLGDWFADTSQLIVADSGQIDAASGSAKWWDVDLDVSAGDTFRCYLGNCVANLVHPKWGAFVFGDEKRFRLYQMSGAVADVIVFVQAGSEAFDDTVELSESIVATMVVT